MRFLPGQNSDNIGDRTASKLIARLDRVPSGMGRDDHVVQWQKPAESGVRSPRHPNPLRSAGSIGATDQCLRIDQPSSTDVDEDRLSLHKPDFGIGNEMVIRRGIGEVKRKDVAFRKNIRCELGTIPFASSCATERFGSKPRISFTKPHFIGEIGAIRPGPGSQAAIL